MMTSASCDAPSKPTPQELSRITAQLLGLNAAYKAAVAAAAALQHPGAGDVSAVSAGDDARRSGSL